MSVNENKICSWTSISTRLTPAGEAPSPRAAHVAAAVGTMVAIQVCQFI